MTTSVHTCHAHGCSRRVPPHMFACRQHWFALPAKLRTAILREYRSGQERDKQPSLRYMAVQRLAVAHAAFRPHDEQAPLVFAGYLAQALVFAAKAKKAGLGDPLEGLVPQAEATPAPAPTRQLPLLADGTESMTKQEAVQLMRDYAAVLKEWWTHPFTPASDTHMILTLTHIIEMPARFPEDGSEDKAMRWLGWIQGALCAFGIYTLEEVKEHVRTKHVTEPETDA